MRAAADPGGPPPGLPADWPHRQHSRSVAAGGLRWHVQVFGPVPGTAPCVLLLHGTGAAGHSWRGLAPLLARRHHTVLVPDLPGHAHTSRPARNAGLSLPGMAEATGALLRALGVSPQWVVGHSAGAAIGARLCLDGHAAPAELFSLNGAWFPPGGAGAWWYAPLARMLVLNPLVPYLFAWNASRPAVLRRLLQGTGSRIDGEGTALYAQLVAAPAHVAGVLAMMANWDLAPLLADLPRLAPRLHLVVGERDHTVPPAQAFELQRRLPAAAVHRLPGLGHLAHEEDPAAVAALLQRLVGSPD